MMEQSLTEEQADGQELDDSLIGTMKINPKSYKKYNNPGFYARTKYAVAGFLFMIRREKSIRNVAKVGIVVFSLAFWLQIDSLHIMMIFLSFAFLWAIETVNSAIETVVDLITQDRHPAAKVAKDVAASATLVATLAAAITSTVFVLPPLIEKINSLLIQ